MNETFNPDEIPNTTNKSDQPCIEPLSAESEHNREIKLVPNDVPTKKDNDASPTLHPTVEISRQLKAPRLANVKPNTVSYQQAHKGVHINIPGSAQMRFGDTLVFYWGVNKSSTQIHLRTITKESTVRVLCISYEFLTYPQFGLVDVYYEVHRDKYLIGTSPVIRVTVHGEPTPTPTPPATPRKAQEKPPTSDDKAA